MIIVEASKVKGDIAGGAAKLIKGAQPRQATATTLNKGFGKVGTGGYINSPVDEEVCRKLGVSTLGYPR